MNGLHSDKSYIYPEDVKSASEGTGKLLAAIGKEIDEHDSIGKVADAKAFAIKSFGLIPYFIAGLFLLSILSMFLMFAMMGGSTSKSVEYENDMSKRIVTTDKSIEYQIKETDGSWYKVDKDVYDKY